MTTKPPAEWRRLQKQATHVLQQLRETNQGTDPVLLREARQLIGQARNADPRPLRPCERDVPHD